MKLSAFLAKHKGQDPYQEIRDVLCGTYEPKPEQLLDTLLAISELGDERPAEFALELCRLCGTSTAEDFLKRIFLHSLPKQLFNAISGSMDESFDALAQAADREWTLSAGRNPSVAIVTPAPRNQVSGAPSPVMLTTVAAVAAASSCGLGQRPQGNHSGRQECKSMILFPFHAKWGDAARRCLPSCSRWEPHPRQVFQIEESTRDEYTAFKN